MSLPFWYPTTKTDAPAFVTVAPGIETCIPENPTGQILDSLSAWDFVFLNGLLAPGVCRLEGGRHIPYDRKNALGQLVGTPSLFAFDPVSFTLILKLWTPVQFKRLEEEILPQVMPKPGPNPDPRAVSIEHPALKLLGVDTVYFEGMSLPREVQPGVKEFEFNCYEWRPPVPVAPKDVDTPLPQPVSRTGRPPNTVTPPSQGSNLGP